MIQQTIVDTIAEFTTDSITTKIIYVETEKLAESNNYELWALVIAVFALVITWWFSWKSSKQNKKNLELNEQNLRDSEKLIRLQNTPKIQFLLHATGKVEIVNYGTGHASNVTVNYSCKSIENSKRTDINDLIQSYPEIFGDDITHFQLNRPIEGISLIVGTPVELFSFGALNKNLNAALAKISIEVKYQDIFEGVHYANLDNIKVKQ